MKTCRDCGGEFEPKKENIAVCSVFTLLIKAKISEDNKSYVKAKSMYGSKYRGQDKKENTYETKYGVDR